MFAYRTYCWGTLEGKMALITGRPVDLSQTSGSASEHMSLFVIAGFMGAGPL
jgi:hypothetical protein